MKTVKIGVIGTGAFGSSHCQRLSEMDNAELTAVCDTNQAVVSSVAKKYQCACYTDYRQLLNSGICEAVLIATPHYSHTTIGIDALTVGLHVLVEKPISVHKADCERLIAAHKNPKQVFAAMFNQRTDPKYLALRDMMHSGQLEKIQRINWTITDWFRNQAYYDSSQWRATWQGEGGGVLLNQCPHQLDLLLWLFGPVKSVRAHCYFGKWHDIEVEDEVTAYLEFQSGVTGVFIASTGEHPGTNRLEIAADTGRVIVEGGGLVYVRNKMGIGQFNKVNKTFMAMPEVSRDDIPVSGKGAQHAGIMKNFVNAILNNEPLIAPAEEGIFSVELANAMLYSSLKDQTVQMPLDGAAYADLLNSLINNSKTMKV